MLFRSIRSASGSLKLRIHCLQHVPFEGRGWIADWANACGFEQHTTHLYRGDPLPELTAADLLVVLGGPMGVGDEAQYPFLGPEKYYLQQALVAGQRMLGICLGAQLVADVLGAPVVRNGEKEIGWFDVHRANVFASTAFGAAFPERFMAFHWHGDRFAIPSGAVALGASAGCPAQGFALDDRVLGLQFHLETTPAMVARLVREAAEDLQTGPFVQSADYMVDAARPFGQINALMSRVMSVFARPVGDNS